MDKSYQYEGRLNYIVLQYYQIRVNDAVLHFILGISLVRSYILSLIFLLLQQFILEIIFRNTIASTVFTASSTKLK